MPNTLLTGRKADLGQRLTVRRRCPSPASAMRRSVGPFGFFDRQALLLQILLQAQVQVRSAVQAGCASR